MQYGLVVDEQHNAYSLWIVLHPLQAPTPCSPCRTLAESTNAPDDKNEDRVQPNILQERAIMIELTKKREGCLIRHTSHHFLVSFTLFEHIQLVTKAFMLFISANQPPILLPLQEAQESILMSYILSDSIHALQGKSKITACPMFSRASTSPFLK